MENKWNRFVIGTGTLLAAASLATTALAADEVVGEGSGLGVPMSVGGEIPTRLSNEPREDEPDGTCSMCTVDDLRLDEEDESGGSTATLELYFEDNGDDEIADIHVRVLLFNGEYEQLSVPSVALLDGQLHVVELPSGPGWSWSDAHYAWVEVQ